MKNCLTFYAQIILKVVIDLKIIYNMFRYSIAEIVDGISMKVLTFKCSTKLAKIFSKWGNIKASLQQLKKDVCIFHNMR